MFSVMSRTIGIATLIAISLSAVSGCAIKPEPFGGTCDGLRFQGDRILANIQILEATKSSNFDAKRRAVWDAGFENMLEYYLWFKRNSAFFSVDWPPRKEMQPDELAVLRVVESEVRNLERSVDEGRFPEAYDNVVSSLKKVQEACPLVEKS